MLDRQDEQLQVSYYFSEKEMKLLTIINRNCEGNTQTHIKRAQCLGLHGLKDELQEYVEVLQKEKTEINEKIRSLYNRRDEAREKFLNMHEYNKQKESEISETESRLAQLKVPTITQ